MDLVEATTVPVRRTIRSIGFEGLEIASATEDTVRSGYDQGSDLAIILQIAQQVQQIIFELL